MTRSFAALILATIGCEQVNGTMDSGKTNDGAPNDGAPNDGGVAAQPPDVIFGGKLVLWLDADETGSVILDAGVVERWKNKSPIVNDAVVIFPGPDGVVLDPSFANGRPAVRLGERRGILQAGAHFGLDWVIAVVGGYTNPISRPGNFCAHAQLISIQGNWMSRSIVLGGNPIYNVVSDSDGWNDGKLHGFGLRSYPLRLRVDGVEKSRSSGILGGQAPFFLGGEMTCDDAGCSVQNPLEGAIAEVVVAFNTSGTPLEMAQLSAYFQKKYGIPF